MKLKVKEKDIVKAFVRLFAYRAPKLLKCLIRIENAASIYNASYRNGLVLGVADFLFDLPSYNKEYRSLWIEFKAKGKKQSDVQLEFQKRVEGDGSKYIVCYDAEVAVQGIVDYLKGDNKDDTKRLDE
jgi:hypothetical protein